MRAVPAARRLFVLAIVLSTTLTAGNIVTSSGVNPTPWTITTSQIFAASWTVSQAYTGVAISATVGGGSAVAASPGTAYLSNGLGAGATTVTSAPFSFPLSFAATNLFTGLSLSPGTYSLVLTATNSSLGGAWRGGSPPITSSDYGESITGYYFALGAGINAADPPASAAWFSDGNAGLEFSVTGDPAGAQTPEPGSLALIGIGLAGLALLRRR